MTNQEMQAKPSVAVMLTKYKAQIEAALPKHMTAERMTRIALTEVRKSKWLQKANPISLMGAIVQAAQIGLEPGNALGHCYLVPFRDDVQLIMGYRGMIELARRSGQVVSLSAHVVYERDVFRFAYGLNEDLHHVPAADDDRGAPTHVYAVARLVGGGAQFHVMTWADVMTVRDLSEAFQAFQAKKIKSTPWDSHPNEMARKTAVRRLFKYLPVSVEIQRAVMLDEHADAGIHQQNAAIIDSEFLVLDDDDEQSEGVTLKDQIKTKGGAPKNAHSVTPLAAFLARVEGAKDIETIDLLQSEAKEAYSGENLAVINNAITNASRRVRNAA